MDEKLGLIYQARIALLQSEIAIDGKHVRLSPGMASAIEIKTEQRRIIEYLLSPLLKYQSEALRERWFSQNPHDSFSDVRDAGSS